MITEKDLNALENKFLDLQIELLKKKTLPESIRISPKRASGKWSLTSTRLANGKWKHSLTTATGTKTLLEDPRSWPPEVKKIIEKFEKLDRQREVNGRLVSKPGGSVRIS